MCDSFKVRDTFYGSDSLTCLVHWPLLARVRDRPYCNSVHIYLCHNSIRVI